ncbi:EF-hand domain-containing protein [Ralstonia insidiosa]|uniref:Calcium-binding protein n=1 Tax=Ralstonia insidiosa TaxID=190721 RepID=A0A192A3G0_9RALS|nr:MULTISPECIES: hypothetical protein [Ralstonia]ANH76141.1 EF hand family protein [Ralstonia insidiosa]ANJ74878.1 calcium-binding protein [Ralstonia insidiosa]EPX94689.1 hypothetical protein C404_27495 [Ralstonia sp. AU12-08]KAB0468403.1 EF-hand domain-containing protein [Ralstonia insidiosa]MBY4708592.1 EF-hand domain-containing protein [Ralstonia insidiosa]
MILRKSCVGLAIMAAFVCASATAQQQTEQEPMKWSIKEAKAKIAERFKAADTNHDGKLTREEAKEGMPRVYENFDKIDIRKRGYVTQRQIGAYWSKVSGAQEQKDNPVWN